MEQLVVSIVLDRDSVTENFEVAMAPRYDQQDDSYAINLVPGSSKDILIYRQNCWHAINGTGRGNLMFYA